MTSYQQIMKWHKKHPKGIKLQPLAFNPPRTEDTMTHAHTKGPWKVSMPHITTEGALGYMATMGNYPEALADACLIAAAPELYEALESIARGLTNGQKERGETAQTIAQAALAKARGR